MGFEDSMLGEMWDENVDVAVAADKGDWRLLYESGTWTSGGSDMLLHKRVEVVWESPIQFEARMREQCSRSRRSLLAHCQGWLVYSASWNLG